MFLFSLLFGQEIKTKKTFFDNQQLKSVLIYQEGNNKSYIKKYFENGNLEIISNYIDNKLEGALCKYYINGMIHEESY